MGMYRVEWDCCGSVTETDGYLPERCPICERDELRRERDELARQNAELAARLAQIEAQETVAWLETDKRGGRMLFCHDSPYPNSVDEYFCVVKTELIARPAPSAAPERAEPTDAELVAAEWPDGFEQAAQSLPTLADAAALFDEQAQAEPGHLEDATMSAAPEQLASRPACDWPGKCKHQRPSPAAAPELAEPADPRTPPPGCRLLGDYEPAQAGDMAYIGAIGGRWRKVRPRMGIIGATMDELSDSARVLALARPCRCGPDSVACPKGGAA